LVFQAAQDTFGDYYKQWLKSLRSGGIPGPPESCQLPGDLRLLVLVHVVSFAIKIGSFSLTKIRKCPGKNSYISAYEKQMQPSFRGNDGIYPVLRLYQA
jgi:hypothetical protein